MRLALIDPAPLEGSRTESLQFLQLAEALASAGAEVALVTPDGGDPQAAAAILDRPTSLGLRLAPLEDRRRRLAYRLLGLARSNKPFLGVLRRWIADGGLTGVDAVYVRNLKLAEALLDQAGVPPVFFHAHEHFARVFAESHDLERWNQRRKLAGLIRREGRVYRGVAGIIATVSPIVADIHADYGAAIPACVVPNGVDLAAAAAALAMPAPARQAERPTALYLGSLHPWKGVGTLVRALAHTRGRVQLLVAGGEAHRIAELEALALELGVAADLRCLGPVPPARRFEAIRGADLVLLPLTAQSGMASRYTSPLKLFEYLAMGKAILASDLPSVRDVVSDGDDALLLPPDAPEAWAAALLELAVDPQRRRRLGEAAAQKALACGWADRAGAILAWMARRITEEKYP